MATVRIQLRRGEYQDWYDANPILAAGELAIETDTNRIKIGDGSTLWTALDYAIVNNDGTPLTTDDYGQPDGVPQLDASGYIKTVNLPPLAKITVHSVANQEARLALTVEPGDLAIQSDTGTSYVLQSSPASTNANWKELTATQAINDAVNAAVSGLLDDAPGALNTLNELAAALGDDANFATTVTTSIGTKLATAGGTMTGALTLSGNPSQNLHATNKSYVDDLIQGYGATTAANLAGHNSTTTNVHGIADTALLATKVYADGVGTTAETNLSNHEADTTSIHGIANTADLATKAYADNAASTAQSAAETTAGTSLTSHSDDTTGIHGITNTANLVYTDDARLSNTRTPTDNTVSTAKIINEAVTSAKISNSAVTSEKIANDTIATGNIADGAVTSAKIANDTIATANIADGAVTSAKIANGAIVNADINESAAIEQSKIANLTTDLGLKAPLASPTFSGTVTLPGTTAIGNVSETELGYLNGVTSAIQTQIDTKLASETATSTYAPIVSPTFSGTVTLPGTTTIGNVSETELGYLNGVTSAIQTQIDSKSSTVSPTFTGTVVLPSTTSVGTVSSSEIAFLDGVTSGIQAQIDTKLASETATSTYAPIASPTFTGTVVLPSTTSVGTVSSTELGYLDGVTSAIQTQLDAKYSSASAATDLALKANLASPELTGTPTAPTAAAATNTTQVATTAFVKTAVDNVIASAPGALDTLNELATALGNDANFSTTITNSLAAKAPLASPTFTGTVTVAADGVAFTDGTQTKAGIPSLTTIGTEISADYNLSTGGLTLRDQLIPIAGTRAITVPANATTAYPVGASIDFYQASGTGANFVEASGVTILRTPGLKLRTTFSSATLTKVATNTWLLAGDLSA